MEGTSDNGSGMSTTAIPLGLCQCGCGQPTAICPMTCKKRGYQKGQPYRYVSGHSAPHSGEQNYTWKGGRRKSYGYVLILRPDHPRASGGYVREHILIAEKALGKPLPPKAEVHHHNEIRSDNRNSNLVICESAYHQLLHRRMRALKACGNPTYRKCHICKQYDHPDALFFAKNKDSTNGPYHRTCMSAYGTNRRRFRSTP